MNFKGNYIHTLSGRGPKVDLDGFFHAYNNFWYDVDGHAFDTSDKNKFVLIEGNYFENVKNPRMTENNKAFFPLQDSTLCTDLIGRACVANKLVNSGQVNGGTIGELYKLKGLVSATSPNVFDANRAREKVLINYGVGKV